MSRCEETGQFKRTELKYGDKFNSWTIIQFSHKSSAGLFYLCKCNCGVFKTVSGHRIARGDSKSCGCYRKRKGQNITHGLREHPMYGVWTAMKQRCYNPKCESYPSYGGRGIIVCEKMA